MSLIVVKRTEEEFAEWLATEWGFLCGLASFDDEPLELESYQLAFLQNRSRFRWVLKSRQTGFSFIFGLEALARCHLRQKHNALFISYSQDEAKEKILIAKQVHEELPLAYQKRLVVDSKTELSFQSNSKRTAHLSRIISVPSRAPRGKRGDVYLDELAHLTNDREVYTGSTALIVRSGGQLTGASSPLGARGVFWEISTEKLRSYPHHTRQFVPWWSCQFFCNDVKKAANDAPQLEVEDRVRRFGRQAIQEQYDSLALEDFQQEFECKFVDETQSFYPYKLILPCMNDLTLAQDCHEFPTPEGRLVAGFDIGRSRDLSELAVFEVIDNQFHCRMLRRFDRMPFSEQEAELRRMLDHLPVARLSIDKSGIGMNLAENLERDYPQVQPQAFTNENKERWATDFKILLQRKGVVLPRDRQLLSQIHSIKKHVLPSGKVSFDAEKSRRTGHADRFWSVALACQRERKIATRPSKSEVRVRVIG